MFNSIALQTAIDERRHELQRRFLESAHIIACTLTGSGLEVLRSASLSIGCVVVDEAAQCIEPEVLVPLQYGCRKVCIMEASVLPPCCRARVIH